VYPVGAPSFGAIEVESGVQSIAAKEAAPTWFIAVEGTIPTQGRVYPVGAPPFGAIEVESGARSIAAKEAAPTM
jgi:hypothetical protein